MPDGSRNDFVRFLSSEAAISSLDGGVNGDVFYGPNVQALVVYLCEEHAVSDQRIKRLMNDMFHLDLSEGTINTIVQRMTKRARALYERIKSKIGKSPVAGADETPSSEAPRLSQGFSRYIGLTLKPITAYRPGSR